MNKSLLLLALCAIVSVFSSHQEDSSRSKALMALQIRSKPSASLFPPLEFGSSLAPSQSTTHPKPHPKPTTTTTPPKPTTTTTPPKPTTTTTPPKPTTTTAPPKPTTTTAPPKPTTTTAPPKPKTTTTPPKPKTTTAPPKPKTTTAPPKPKTTTTPPKPPTTHSPTTAHHTTAAPPQPTPTPSAPLTSGNYTVKSKDGVLCLMALMALQIRVANNKTNGTFNVQQNLTKTDGSCEKATANLTITFKEGFITFLFNKNTSQNAVYVNAVSFKLSYPFKSGVIVPYSAKNQSVHLFPAAIGHSYSCKSDSVYMGNGLYLDVTQDRMQAFNLTNNKDFGMFDACPADRPDYRVAIAVGIVLLVLIIIVVVAYLLGRRKRADGYQSL